VKIFREDVSFLSHNNLKISPIIGILIIACWGDILKPFNLAILGSRHVYTPTGEPPPPTLRVEVGASG
jgi:hypothetical protein